jgi:hypothetical protein
LRCREHEAHERGGRSDSPLQTKHDLAGELARVRDTLTKRRAINDAFQREATLWEWGNDNIKGDAFGALRKADFTGSAE